MHTSLKKLIAVLFVVALVLPASSQAASLTAEQISSVIGLLQSFNVEEKTIATVRAVLNNTQPPRPEWNQGSTTGEREGREGMMPPGQVSKMACVTLMRNLGIGSRGDDVRELQKVLVEDRELGFVGSTTGYYGPMTARAMMRFQVKNGIASTTSGAVGPLTRGYFERRCGYGLGKLPPQPQTSATGTTPQP